MPEVADVPRAIATRECEGPWCGDVRRRGFKVADVVEYSSGMATVVYRDGRPGVGVYASMKDADASMRRDYGQDATIEWVDVHPTEASKHGAMNALQDYMENAAFASVGGVDKRGAMTLPPYVADADAAEWARGYVRACCSIFGDDWRTCGFGWVPTGTIGGEAEAPPCPA